MSIIKVINGTNKYYNTDAKEDTIEYILDPAKTKHGYVGGVAISAICPAQSMMLVSERFNKTNGVQLRHYVISFAQSEVRNPKIANDIAVKISAYIAQEMDSGFFAKINADDSKKSDNNTLNQLKMLMDEHPELIAELLAKYSGNQ